MATSPKRTALKEQSDAAVAAYEKALADARAGAQAIANETRDKLRRRGREAAARQLEGRAQRQAGRGREDHRRHQDRGDDATCAASRPTPPRAIVERLIGTAPAGSAVEAAVADALKR